MKGILLEKPNRRFVGFTLLELVVVMAILGLLVTATLIMLDPSGQFAKVNDATRRRDLNEIRNALDTYYNDNNCYPQSIPFGDVWQENGVVYMKKVPQDPSCGSNKENCYVYEVDNSQACPQWNVVYAKQQRTDQVSCSLRSFTSACTPVSFDPKYSCAISGNVDCSFIATMPISGGGTQQTTGTQLQPRGRG